MNRRSAHFLVFALLVLQAGLYAAWAQSKAVSAVQGLKGKVQAVSPKMLDIQTPSGVAHVAVQQPLTTYARVPSDLSKVKSDSFIGVTSEKQPDGTEVAKEIHIFPAEMRGLGLGSNPIETPGAATASRMTNGAVVRPKATPVSRMTNGTVQKQGTTLVVKYQDGAQTVTVPPNVEVTQIVPKKMTLAPGDTVNALVQKGPDGTLTTSKVYVIASGAASK